MPHSDALQPIIFLSAETTRGPPWAGAQSPRLFDGARDRPAPHPCASPPPSEFPLHDLIVGTQRNVSAHSSIGGGEGERLARDGQVGHPFDEYQDRPHSPDATVNFL